MPVDGGREALLSYLVEPVFQSNVRGNEDRKRRFGSI
jgi:hypothetical protein